MNNVFIDETRGSAYRLADNGEVEFAPLSTDGSYDFENGGIVEVWSEDGEEAAIAEEKRVREGIANATK